MNRNSKDGLKKYNLSKDLALDRAEWRNRIHVPGQHSWDKPLINQHDHTSLVLNHSFLLPSFLLALRSFTSNHYFFLIPFFLTIHHQYNRANTTYFEKKLVAYIFLLEGGGGGEGTSYLLHAWRDDKGSDPWWGSTTRARTQTRKKEGRWFKHF